jgi:hypothetical protein
MIEQHKHIVTAFWRKNQGFNFATHCFTRSVHTSSLSLLLIIFWIWEFYALVSKGASQDKLMVGRLFIVLEDGLTSDQQYVLPYTMGMELGLRYIKDMTLNWIGLDWTLS